jgi:hypothetical protein
MALYEKKKRPPSPYPDLVPISFVIKERLFCHFTESFKTREEEEAGRRAEQKQHKTGFSKIANSIATYKCKPDQKEHL